jgi:DNA-binding MarR family transcriptional regulator
MGSQTMSTPQRVLDSIRQIVRLLREGSRDSEERVGLSAAQLFVLQKLDPDEPLSLNELSARTLTHQSSVSVVVSRLV